MTVSLGCVSILLRPIVHDGISAKTAAHGRNQQAHRCAGAKPCRTKILKLTRERGVVIGHE